MERSAMTDISASSVVDGFVNSTNGAPYHTAHIDSVPDAKPSARGSRVLIPRGARYFHRLFVETAKTDHIWAAVRQEAEAVAKTDRVMAHLISRAVLDQHCLEDAIAARVAQRLATPEIGVDAISDGFRDVLADEPSIGDAMRVDLAAFCERDPACDRYIEPLLYFKGYHALQTHRLAHWLWRRRHQDLALWLQSRSSEVFQTDINPAARIGKGIFLDHATGVVIGSTAVVDDDVSILHEVTLGGTGKESGDRHPKIQRGVLIGAGAKILGNITVGAGAKVAAGSVVLNAVPANTTVAGVPARVVGRAGPHAPAHTMDQMLTEEASADEERPIT
jgi:serine O-acetyltransferase